MVFRPIYYGEQERGKKIPNTKRRYIWVFQIDNQEHQLNLFCSFLSSKRMIILDGITLHQSRNFTFDFEWKHQLGDHLLRIKQQISVYPLYVDGFDFIVKLQQQAWGPVGSSQNQHQRIKGLKDIIRQPFNKLKELGHNNISGWNSGSKEMQNYRGQSNSVDISQVQILFPGNQQKRHQVIQIQEVKELEDDLLLMGQDSDQQDRPWLSPRMFQKKQMYQHIGSS